MLSFDIVAQDKFLDLDEVTMQRPSVNPLVVKHQPHAKVTIHSRKPKVFPLVVTHQPHVVPTPLNVGSDTSSGNGPLDNSCGNGPLPPCRTQSSQAAHPAQPPGSSSMPSSSSSGHSKAPQPSEVSRQPDAKHEFYASDNDSSADAFKETCLLYTSDAADE